MRRNSWKENRYACTSPTPLIQSTNIKENVAEVRVHLLNIIEPHGFTWVVFFVASSGFLADSYSIFSTNVVTPALAYIYWSSAKDGLRGLTINGVTLGGTVIGMVLFGHLADRVGRKRLYGTELVIGIIATIGLTQASGGYNNSSMSAYGWILFWRLILGVGIGAEYPLSALIAAEWCPTSARGTMLAAVFMMQPIGQFLAYIVGFGALRGISHDQGSIVDWTSNKGKTVIDIFWRCVIGVGGVPALIAIALRLSIPETPRFLIDVMEDFQGAVGATQSVYPPTNSAQELPPKKKMEEKVKSGTNLHWNGEKAVGSSGTSAGNSTGVTKRKTGSGKIQGNPTDDTTASSSKGANEADRSSEDPRDKAGDKKSGFWDEWESGKGFGRALAGLSICWFLMDFCFYGLGLDTPRTLAKLWGAQPSDATGFPDFPQILDWKAGYAPQDNNIYDALNGDVTRAMYTVSTGSLVGSIVFLLLVNYIPRVTVLRWAFVILSSLFLIIGGSLFGVYQNSNHSVTIVFYAFALLVFNIGPNTILFMLPAEIFPTRYRGTCYGIAAASGKLGAISSQLILHYTYATDPRSQGTKLGILILCFAPLMLIAAFVAWIWIPEVQELRGDGSSRQGKSFRMGMQMPPRSLEEISLNPRKDQIFGFREHWRHFFGLDSRRQKSNV
jgi:PHS family inorganic phosphate transporter-like MFS transporter